MIGELLSLGGNLLNNFFAGERQEDAQQFSAQQFASRYQTTVKDMQAAGLNPALAYQQGGGTAPTSSAASASGSADLGMVHLQSKMNAAQVANIDADTKNKEAQAENIRADTMLKVAQEALTGASADQTRTNISYLETQVKRITEEIKNIPKEGDRLDALVKNLAEEYKLIKEKTNSQEQATNQMRWLAVKTMLESDLAGFDVKAAQDLGNLGRYSKEGKVVLDVLRMLKGK